MLPKDTVPWVKGAYRHEEEGEVVAVSNININSSCNRSACYIKMLTIQFAQNATLSTLIGKKIMPSYALWDPTKQRLLHGQTVYPAGEDLDEPD